MDGFYATRSRTIPPLPWTNFAPPFSMWAQYLSLLCLIVPEVAFVALGYDVASPRLWWVLAVLFAVYGILGRIKDQGLSK